MRKALWGVVIACALAQEALAGAPERPQRTIPCSEIIGHTAFPYPGSYQQRDRYRLVLESVSVPPAYLSRSHPTGKRPWSYFAKRGMVVRRGTAVTITVPPAWRKRAAIAWGNGGHGPFHTIRIAACRSSRQKPGNAYAGGFFLRSRSACLPLRIIIGSRAKTMWFGIGKNCR